MPTRRRCGTGNIYKEVQKYVYFGYDICTDRFFDYLIMTGVSNWGALALSSALVIMSQDYDAKQYFVKECYNQKQILKNIISNGGYDGVSGKAELSIDGMEFDNQHWDVIQKIVEIVKETL